MLISPIKNLDEISKAAVWRQSNRLTSLSFSSHSWHWLSDQESLTQRLIDVSGGEFEVDLLSQQIQVPLVNEQRSLNQAQHLAATVRQVCLRIHSTPIVLARSIIPLDLIKQSQNGLTSLGKQPLGQLLFKEGRVRTDGRQYMKSRDGMIIGRKTPYEYAGANILVSEFYLPRISEFKFW